MDELLVLIIKMIIRGLNSASEKPTKPYFPIPSGPSAAGKAASVSRLPGTTNAKAKTPPLKRPAPVRPSPIATKTSPAVPTASRAVVERAAIGSSLPRSASPASQIAEALQSRKNLVTVLAMTELLAKPVALRRAGLE